jgi:aryl-alcohol dehydrogenase-like predicted oxidoreductase
MRHAGARGVLRSDERLRGAGAFCTVAQRHEVTAMKYRKLGRTGLEVSTICLGAMTYGEPERGTNIWTLPEDESKPIIKYALDKGITFIDCANTYSDGSSEEIMGRVLKDLVPREDIVLATKVFMPTQRKDRNAKGLSRKAILREIDASLKRLQVDYVDLYQIHRWDDRTPIEETMEALHDVVKSGKARYIGASSMYAWQFAKAQHAAEMHGWTKFVSMQNQVNLIYREEEREMLPLCADMGVAVLPWSPLARGRLARPPGDITNRSENDPFARVLYDATVEADRAVIEANGRVAERHGVGRASIALAWLLRQPVVTAPIIGASKLSHVDDALAALEVTLTDEDVAELEQHYTPRKASW